MSCPHEPDPPDPGAEHGPDRQPDPEPDQAAQDAAWQEIVDNYGEHPEFPPTPDRGHTHEYVVDSPAPRPSYDDGADLDDPEDEDLHYVPPPAPPVVLPQGARLAAWAGVFVPPLLLVIFLIAGVGIGGWVGFAMFAAFLAGFGYLVWHMRRGEDDDPWDDGAVV